MWGRDRATSHQPVYVPYGTDYWTVARQGPAGRRAHVPRRRGAFLHIAKVPPGRRLVAARCVRAFNTMQESSAQTMNAHGVCVVRGSSRGCAACLAEVLAGLDRKLSLPGVMNARPPERHFLPVQMTVASDTQVAAHQRDFKLLFSSCIEAMLRDALSGEAGATLSALLGPDAELQELTAMISEPGAASQAVHSDDTWSAHGAPRRVTLFLALHDIDDEAMGPTRFWPETHAPRCFPGRTSSSTTSSLACLPAICLSVCLFPDERWLPPTEARVAQRPPSCWFALSAGDAVLMDSLTWHCGGANSSGRRRTLLSASFVEPTPGRLGSGGAATTTPRLGDFV